MKYNGIIGIVEKFGRGTQLWDIPKDQLDSYVQIYGYNNIGVALRFYKAWDATLGDLVDLLMEQRQEPGNH